VGRAAGLARGRVPAAGPPHPHVPRLRVDLDAVNARYRAIFTASADYTFHAALAHSAADVPALVSEVERLYLLVISERRHLTAAAGATLAAAADQEADPLAYLRDELTYGLHPGTGRGRR
jgi:hypothetical protein